MLGNGSSVSRDPADHAQVLEQKFESHSCVPVGRAATFSPGEWTLTVSDGPELTTDLRSPRGWNVMLPNVDLPACFLHFQGHTKWAIPIVCNLVGKRLNGSSIPPLLLQQKIKQV